MPLLVVGAAILDDLAAPTRLLAARRSAPSSLAGMWEFPGGKVEPGESPVEGIVREIREELGVEVTLGSLVPGPGDGAVWPVHRDHTMIVWTAVMEPGSQPQMLEDHDELRWLPAGEWHSVPWLPADRPIVDAVAAQLGVPAQ